MALWAGDETVHWLAPLLPGQHGEGETAGLRTLTLPPLVRSAMILAQVWKSVWKQSEEARHAG